MCGRELFGAVRSWPVACCVAWLCLAALAGTATALSSERAGNLFTADEDIVLNTRARGTAQWTLSNDYNETIRGSSPVRDGRIRIPTHGLRYGRYIISVEGDDTVVGGVVAPMLQVHPDLAPLIFAVFRHNWNHPEEALMWKQLGAWEMRYEFGFNNFNPREGEFVYDQAIDTYIRALHELGIRPSFKLGGPPAWNDSSTVPRKRGEPKDYAAYERTVQEFARHFLPMGMDRYYIVNEPEAGGWWSAGWPGYYRFLEANYRALKAVDPNILVVAPNSWSNSPEFVDTVLKSGHLDLVAGHYPVEKIIGNIHGYFYYTRMSLCGVNLPFINAEDFSRWRSQLFMSPVTKNYPGITPYSSLFGVGPVMMASMDVGAYRVVELHLMYDREPWPFAKWAPGEVILDDLCFQHRAISDQFAGAQLVGRVPETPPNVLAWVFKRGNDRFVGAFVPVGQMTQLMRIDTNRRLRVVDCYGNQRIAEPVEGQVRVLLTNADVYVHGLAATDRISFIPHTANERPTMGDVNNVVAVVGIPFRLQLAGYDPDSDLVMRRFPRWRLGAAPAGMTIREGSGLIEWTPTAAGTVSVTVDLIDPDGAGATRTISIDVAAAGTNLPPRFRSAPTPVAVINGAYRYQLKTEDPNGDPVSYALQGPAGMTLADGAISWRPTAMGVFPVRITATDGRGGQSEQRYELTVCPNPDRPSMGMAPPRAPTDLTVTASSAEAVTLVWNHHAFASHVVQKSAGRGGPWRELAVVKENHFTDRAPGAAAFYRVISRHAGGDSEPSNVVNGRNRAPIAEAGPSFKLEGPGTVTLDGRMSFDPEGAPLRYEWSLIAAPRGARATIAEPAAAQTAFTVDRSGRYVVGLRVNDGEEDSAMDYLWVVVGVDEYERVIWAGPDRFATVGEAVALAPGSASPARRQSRVFWRWDTSPIDAFEAIVGSDRPQATLRPPKPGVYHINLHVLDVPDQRVYGYPDTVRVIVGPR
jgi:hypothetical protein